MTDLNLPGAASEGLPDGAGRTTAGTGRVRFSLARWVLAPRTTWQARRLAADFGEGMDARTAWVMARLARHPDERGYVLGHLDNGRPAPD
ncbi:hypothetical protein ACWD3J_47425 [Streptomyces sp. NPDC002755]|uniref:hypothetical protein n=1 Tax=Streptomyces sp. NPDC002884 TaxID=3154544 RepID=UPI00332581A9